MTKSRYAILLIITMLTVTSVKADTSNFNVSTKTILRLTNAKSIEELVMARTQEMHQTLQYFTAYEKCENSFSKKIYLYNNIEKFVKDTKLAKTSWNEFIDKKLRNQINEKLSDLTKDNLKDKYKECKLRKRDINLKMNEFERNLIKTNPNFKGLGLDYNRDRPKIDEAKITHTELNAVNLPIKDPLDPTRQEMRQMIDTKVVYLKKNESIENLETAKKIVASIDSNTSVCKRQGGKAMECMCDERINYEELNNLVGIVLNNHPEWKKVTFYNKDKKGVRIRRFPFGGISLRLKHFNKYCDE